jgi:4-amino-4-deoxy-L-arabinose transferase-like glycosyltransferase
MVAMIQPGRTRLTIALIILSATVLYLVGNGSVPLWDRDEPRYAQTSRQMLQSGDWVVPRLLDEVRTAKPIFIYWCQATAMRLFGDNAFAARFPSAVAMVLTLAVLGAVIGRAVGGRRAQWTVLVLGSSALVIATAKMCLTDSVLLLWITIAQVCLVGIYLRHGPSAGTDPGPVQGRGQWLLPIIMWTAVALAGLTKGPVVLGVQLMTLLALAVLDVGQNFRSRGHWLSAVGWWRDTRPMLGLILIVLICGPWLVLIERRAPGFLTTSIWHDVVTRTRTGLEGHKGPPGYYLLTIWATYFPWSLFLPATLVWAWKQRNNPLHRFCLAAVIGPWVMFEIVQTKLVHYVLPVFPALALLTADMLIGAARRGSAEIKSRGFVAAVRGWCVVVTLIGLLPWLALRYFALPPAAIAAMVLLAGLCLAYAFAVYWQFRGHRVLRGASVMGGGMMLIIAVVFGGYFPHATFLQISPRIGQVLRSEGAVESGDAVMIDYTEDTLAFYQGGTIRRQGDSAFLLHTHRWEWPMWIVLTDRIWQITPGAIRAEFDVIASVKGLWYVKGGRVVEVLVIRRKMPYAHATED